MPWPDNDSPWPPKELAEVASALSQSEAWWRGDPKSLRDAAAKSGDGGRFWARAERRAAQDQAEQARRRLHFPIARDLARTSADLLFGDGIELVADEAAMDSLAALQVEVGLDRQILQAAEIAAGIGGVFFRPAWRMMPTNAAAPRLTTVHPTHAVPWWDGPELTEVIFWTQLEPRGNDEGKYRLLERWTPGLLEHRLYLGTKDLIGKPVDLALHPSTARRGLLPLVPLLGTMAEGLLPVWVPNVLPHPLFPLTRWGRADTEGTESLMDALDETWTSLLRDVDLGKARIVAPMDFLRRTVADTPKRRGAGATFNVDQEVFTGVDADPETMQKLEAVQFAIRSSDHLATSVGLVETIVGQAGYSPESFGLNTQGLPLSGTAYRLRERKTIRTQAKKRRYWEASLPRVVRNLLAVRRENLDRSTAVVEPEVVWGEDETLSDPASDAATLEVLLRAGAISIETAVRRAQPELDDDAVAEEVARIRADRGVVEDPTGLGGLV